jgi:hypothetical protein
MAKGFTRKEENLKFQEQTIINTKNDLHVISKTKFLYLHP